MSASLVSGLVGAVATTAVVVASATPAWASGSASFAYTGGSQSFTVPAGVTRILVDAAGASGAGYSGIDQVNGVAGSGGPGGRERTVVSVTPGQVLQINVGGAGSGPNGGFNGGANSPAVVAGRGGGGGGGGASDVRAPDGVGHYPLSNRLAVAAGGGGGGSGVDVGGVGTPGAGGAGGGTTGWGGGSGSDTVVLANGGGGGTQTAGGAAGCSNVPELSDCAGTGSLGSGGAGGGSTDCVQGGGGGGGYYGGGGGAGSACPGGGGGGGGGSSYPPTSGFPATESRTNFGNGSVTLTYSGSGGLASLAGHPVLASEVRGGADPAAPQVPVVTIGDPINPSTGFLSENVTDLATPGRGMALTFARTYSSDLSATNGPLGLGWTDSYNMSLAFGSGSPPATVTVTEQNGSQVVFDYNAGSASYAPDAPRDNATLVKGSGTPAWTYTRIAKSVFDFNSAGQLLDEHDLNGNTTTVGPISGSTQSISDPAGRTYTLTWSGGHISQVAEPAGGALPARAVIYAYTGNLLTSVTDVNGGVTGYGYDANGRLAVMRTPRFASDGAMPAAPTTCSGTPPRDSAGTVYDSTTGRVLCQWDPLGRETTLTYTTDADANPETVVTDPKGNEVAYSYSQGVLVATTQAYGTSAAATTSDVYDPSSAGVEFNTDPNGATSSASYDANNNQNASTDPAGHSTTTTFDALTDPLTATDGRGVVTTSTYDAAGNLLSESTPLLDGAGNQVVNGSPVVATTTYGHTDGHPEDVTSKTDPDGNVWTYTYDATRGYRTSEAAPSTTDNQEHPGVGQTNTTLYAYDPIKGWPTLTVSPRGQLAGITTSCAPPALGCTVYSYADATKPSGYDLRGQATVVTDPNGHTTKTQWDLDGNVVSKTDGDNNTTTFTFDPAEEQTVTTRPDTTTLKTDYNLDSTVKDRVDGGNNMTSYGYDALRRVTSVTTPPTATSPSGQTTTYGYDPAGHRVTKADPGGTCPSWPISYPPVLSTAAACAVWGYDPAGEVTSITYSDGVTPDLTGITYDGDGQRTSMTENAATPCTQSTWAWDSLHRLLSAGDLNCNTVRYGYTDATKPQGYELVQPATTLAYPGGGGTITRAYDPLGRMASVTDWQGRTSSFLFDADNTLRQSTTPTTGTPVVDSFTADNADQLSAVGYSQGASSIGSESYTRDNANQLKTVTGSGSLAGSHTYGYNTLNQLNSADGAGYSYNGADDPTALPGGVSQGYDPASELTNRTVGTATSYIFDNRGDRTQQTGLGLTSYNYDQAQRLTTTTSTNQPTIAFGYDHILAVKSDTTVWASGWNSHGQLGNATIADSSTPVQVSSLSGVKSVAAGASFSLALKTDGTVWAWGDNTCGELGDNTTTDRSTPIQVSGLSGVVSIAAGDNNSLAITSDGTLWQWGTGPGPCGSGSGPAAVSGISGVVQAAEGYNHTVALKSDGTVWAWGDNTYGELGNNSTTSSTTPVQVSGLTGVRAIGTLLSSYHSLAIKSDGTVWAWGNNSNGQLGNNSTTNALVPVQVNGLTGVASVAAGYNHTIAVKTDGTVWAWGYNASGQLGNGTLTESHVPVQTSNLTNALGVAGGGYNSVAVTSDGTIAAWGNNQYGQLGNGTTTSSATPQNEFTGASPNQYSYTYNGDGLRLTKTGPGSSQRYSWDTSGDLPLLLLDGPIKEIYGPGGLPLEQIDSSGTVTWYHHDQLGSTRTLTNATGTVTGTYAYDPYGDTTSHTGTAATNLQYAGEYRDAETGFVYLRARYYDPAAAQFLTRDSLAAATTSPYAYASDNPVANSDPTGRFTTTISCNCPPDWSVIGQFFEVGGGKTTLNARVSNHGVHKWFQVWQGRTGGWGQFLDFGVWNPPGYGQRIDRLQVSTRWFAVITDWICIPSSEMVL